MPVLSLENLLSWMAQVFVLASIGAILPLVFRVRHPRWHLFYCHVLLIACMALPFIQPWQHGSNGNENASFGIFGAIVFWIFAAGLLVRFCRLLAGLLQLQRYRKASLPLIPEPAPVFSARQLTQTKAEVRTSLNDIGPVTFGVVRPVVLFPESFLALSEPAQCGIACHEFLHVQRKDWLVAVLEETAGACLWFHPAIWWVLAQAKLAREQIVDKEVIRRTDAREPYIEALLTMAGITPKEGLAAPFLSKRHLARRMNSLLAEEPMSSGRLWTSYASYASFVSMAGILVVVGLWAFAAFPLTSRIQNFEIAEIHHAARPELTLPPAAGPVANMTKDRKLVSLVKANNASQSALAEADLNPAYTDTIEAPLDPLVFAAFPEPTALPDILPDTSNDVLLINENDGVSHAQNFIATPPANYAAKEETIPAVPVSFTAPKLIRQVLPLYSDRARMARIAGSVVLKAIVRKDGTVTVLGVLNNIGYGLDESAAQAAEQWKFQPATSDGVAVDIALNLEVRFNLR